MAWRCASANPVRYDARPREGVNGLGRIAHDAQVGLRPRPQLQQPVLQGADVLELVDQQVTVDPAHLGQRRRLVAEHRDRAQQHVVEVDQAAVGLELFVAGIHPPDHRGVDAVDLPSRGLGDLGVVGRQDVAHLGPRDLGRQVAQPAGVHPAGHQAVGRVGDDPDPVVGDPGQFAAVGLGPEVLRLAQRRGMERARLDLRHAQAAQPPTQLPAARVVKVTASTAPALYAPVATP